MAAAENVSVLTLARGRGELLRRRGQVDSAGRPSETVQPITVLTSISFNATRTRKGCTCSSLCGRTSMPAMASTKQKTQKTNVSRK
jgi:hypothetical protein